MTSSTATIKAVTDGTTTENTDAKKARRANGITRAREDQVYYMTGLAGSALYEAEQLLKTIQNTASASRIDYDGSKGTEPLDMTCVVAVLSEALDCIDIAAEHLSALNTDIRCRQADDEP